MARGEVNGLEENKYVILKACKAPIQSETSGSDTVSQVLYLLSIF